MNILFTSVGRRNYLLNYFKEIDEVKVFACDADINAPGLFEADEWFVIPRFKEINYIPLLLQESIERKIDAIISLNDLELPLLANCKHIFKKEGIEVLISSTEVIDICFDKFKTYLFSKEVPVETIPTFLEPVEALEFEKLNPGCKFIVKPRQGSASLGLQYPKNSKELLYSYNNVRKIVESSILGEMDTSIMEPPVIIQRRIFGVEYGIDVVNNLKGVYQGTLIRKKLSMRAGETEKAITLIDKEILEIGCAIGNLLGHIGNLDCDLFLEDGRYYLLEMNPRFGGGYPFMHYAGANLPKAIVTWLKKNESPKSELSYRHGVASAKVDRMVGLGNDSISIINVP